MIQPRTRHDRTRTVQNAAGYLSVHGRLSAGGIYSGFGVRLPREYVSALDLSRYFDVFERSYLGAFAPALP